MPGSCDDLKDATAKGEKYDHEPYALNHSNASGTRYAHWHAGHTGCLSDTAREPSTGAIRIGVLDQGVNFV